MTAYLAGKRYMYFPHGGQRVFIHPETASEYANELSRVRQLERKMLAPHTRNNYNSLQMKYRRLNSLTTPLPSGIVSRSYYAVQPPPPKRQNSPPKRQNSPPKRRNSGPLVWGRTGFRTLRVRTTSAPNNEASSRLKPSESVRSSGSPRNKPNNSGGASKTRQAAQTFNNRRNNSSATRAIQEEQTSSPAANYTAKKAAQNVAKLKEWQEAQPYRRAQHVANYAAWQAEENEKWAKSSIGKATLAAQRATEAVVGAAARGAIRGTRAAVGAVGSVARGTATLASRAARKAAGTAKAALNSAAAKRRADAERNKKTEWNTIKRNLENMNLNKLLSEINTGSNNKTRTFTNLRKSAAPHNSLSSTLRNINGYLTEIKNLKKRSLEYSNFLKSKNASVVEPPSNYKNVSSAIKQLKQIHRELTSKNVSNKVKIIEKKIKISENKRIQNEQQARLKNQQEAFEKTIKEWENAAKEGVKRRLTNEAAPARHRVEVKPRVNENTSLLGVQPWWTPEQIQLHKLQVKANKSAWEALLKSGGTNMRLLYQVGNPKARKIYKNAYNAYMNEVTANKAHANAKTRAATKIQKIYRGFVARTKLKQTAVNAKAAANAVARQASVREAVETARRQRMTRANQPQKLEFAYSSIGGNTNVSGGRVRK